MEIIWTLPHHYVTGFSLLLPMWPTLCSVNVFYFQEILDLLPLRAWHYRSITTFYSTWLWRLLSGLDSLVFAPLLIYSRRQSYGRKYCNFLLLDRHMDHCQPKYTKIINPKKTNSFLLNTLFDGRIKIQLQRKIENDKLFPRCNWWCAETYVSQKIRDFS